MLSLLLSTTKYIWLRACRVIQLKLVLDHPGLHILQTQIYPVTCWLHLLWILQVEIGVQLAIICIAMTTDVMSLDEIPGGGGGGGAGKKKKRKKNH